MSEGEIDRLPSWLHERAAEGTVRVAARDDDGWIDRKELTNDVEWFRVDLAADPEERYDLLLDESDEELRLEGRTRLVFRVIGVNEDQFLQRENVEILVELPGVDPEEVLEFGTETLTLPASVLDRVDSGREAHENYQSVAANRVAGLEPEKRRLVRFLETGNRQWGLSEPTGVILEGPPGTGKTELVMEICQERYGSVPVTLSGPEVLNKWVGESERLLRQKFEETLDSTHRILFIDELDAIAQKRSESSQDYTAQLVSQLLVLLDGVETKGRDPDERPLRVMASTNIAHVIDSALRRPGRLGNRPIHVGRPSEKERIAILHHYLESIYASSGGRLGDELRRGVTREDGIEVLRRLALEMEGFTGADIEDVVQEAVSRTRNRDEEVLTVGTLEEVLRTAFSRPTRYRTREFTGSDLPERSSQPASVSLGQRVIELDAEGAEEDRAEQVAKGYFAELERTAPDDRRYVFRTVTPRDLLADDPARTRERTVEAFQHPESERLCVYLRGIGTLAQARTHSSSVQTVIEVLNEQLIRWSDENVLLVDANEETESLLCFSD